MQKRVIFINRYFFPDLSATSQMLGDLAFDLARQGISLHVVTSRQTYENARAALAATATEQGVNIHRVPSTRFGRGGHTGRLLDYLTFHFWAAVKLLFLARRDDIVVAKTDPPLLSVTASFVCEIKRARLVNWLQDLFPEVLIVEAGLRADSLALRGLVALRNRSLRKAAFNVCLGKVMAQRVVGCGVPESAVRIIANWSDASRVYPVVPAENPVRREWQLQDLFVVGYSGNLGVAHEFETILAAACGLREDPRIVFVFIGGGAKLKQLKARVAELGLTNVRFEPYQPMARLAESLSTADVHLVSLRPEMEGLVVPSKFYGVIAAARPCVFIGSSTGELARVITEAGCGAVVNASDSQALMQAIKSMADDPIGTARMGAAAHQLFRDHHDRGRSIARWAGLLNEMMR